MSIEIIQGHALDVLSGLPDESAHCVVTSPPYYGLRDYGLEPLVWGGEADCKHEWGKQGVKRVGRDWDPTAGESPVGRNYKGSSGQFCRLCGAWLGSLGLEPTPDLYVEHLVEIFREVRRVLKKDGILFLNLGDSYATGAGKVRDHPGGLKQGKRWQGPKIQPNRLPLPGLKPKDLIGIPWRVAFALQADGWWLRSDTIEEVELYCPCCGYVLEERIWRYSQDRDIIWHKPNTSPESVKDRPTKAHEYIFLLTKNKRYSFNADAVKEPCRSGPSDIRKMREKKDRIGGKNKTADDPKLAASRHTNIGRKRAVGSPKGRNIRSVWKVATQPGSGEGVHFAPFPERLAETCIKAGCPEGGTVLDPFCGSGTVGVVAQRFGCRFIGIDLSPVYTDMAEQRTSQRTFLGAL